MDSSTPPRADALTAAARAAVAGCIDALGLVTLGGILVAHMSGNTAVGAFLTDQPRPIASRYPDCACADIARSGCHELECIRGGTRWRAPGRRMPRVPT